MKKLYLLTTILPTLLLATPNAPLNLTFSNVTATSVVLNWQDTSHSETGYKIFRDNIPIATIGKNSISFKDSGLTPNHPYNYTIKATDDQPNWVSTNSIKESFGTNSEPLKFHLSNLAGGDKDWLGIFKVGVTLKRDNLLGWTYTNGLQNGDITIDTIYPNQGHLSAGRYQIVTFYNDSYTPETTSYFDVKDTLTINTTKDIYHTDEHDIVVNLTNAPTKANNSDWLGIFKEGATNENNSVHSWKYTNDAQAINGNGKPYGTVTLQNNNLPEGNYEVRFFANDTYTLLTKSSFKISDGEVPADNYGKRGNKTVIKVENDNNDQYKVYYPEGVQNSPVVVFLAGWQKVGENIYKYTAMMDFIASQGYYVIGLSYQYYTKYRLVDKLQAAHADNNRADTSKVSIVGHSIGGAFAFEYLQYIRENGYAQTKHSILELDGWFTLNMTPTEVRNLDTTSLIIQYSGADGIPKFQDPKINLAVYHMLEGDEKALLHIEANNDHSYQNGDVNNANFSAANFIAKQDLLRPVHAFLDYTLKGTQSAKSIAMEDKYQDVEQYVANPNEANAPYEFSCIKDDTHDDGLTDYNYCDLNKITSFRETWNR